MGDEKKAKTKVSMMAIRSQSTTRSMANLGYGSSISRTKMRRQSFGFSGVPGMKPMERTSHIALEFRRPPLMFLNTYQLEPHSLWNVASVTKLAEEVLDTHFTGHKYNAQQSPALALRIAGELMRRVKAMNFNRYRAIVVVTLAQKRAQSYNNAISFLWDSELDRYMNTQREESTAFIQVLETNYHFIQPYK